MTNPQTAKQKFFSELKLIYGIGKYYEKELRKSGYKTIDDLLEHHRFCFPAKEFIDLLNKNKGYELFRWLERRYPKSHPLVFLNSSFYSSEDFIFIDIESLGLHGYPLFLVGIAYFEGSYLLIEQIIARDMDEEAAVLAYLNEKAKKKKVIGSFNGKSFDIPVIKDRMNYYGIDYSFEQPHFDIFHFANRAFKGKIYNCQLTTLESELFKIKRKNHVPSFMVPNYYNAYLKSKNIGTLVPIIEHNKQDIISTVKLFGKLHELCG